MTRKLLSLLLLIAILVFTSAANAEELTTGNARSSTDAATKLKLQTQLIQEQKKTAISKAKEEAKTLIQAKKDEFKVRLQEIKDLRKKTLVEKIDAKLAEVNLKHTTKYLEIILRLQTFIDKIKQATSNPDILAKIEDVQTAIDSAKAAVETQAEKTYIVTITTENALKLNVGKTVSQLRKDLQSAHGMVLDLKQAVQKLNMEKNEIKKEASESADI